MLPVEEGLWNVEELHALNALAHQEQSSAFIFSHVFPAVPDLSQVHFPVVITHLFVSSSQVLGHFSPLIPLLQRFLGVRECQVLLQNLSLDSERLQDFGHFLESSVSFFHFTLVQDFLGAHLLSLLDLLHFVLLVFDSKLEVLLGDLHLLDHCFVRVLSPFWQRFSEYVL